MRYSYIYICTVLLCFGCQNQSSLNTATGYHLPSGSRLALTTNAISNSNQLLNNLMLFGFKETLDNNLLQTVDSLGLAKLSMGFYTRDNKDIVVLSGKVSATLDPLSETLAREFKSANAVETIYESLYKLSFGEDVLISNDSTFLSTAQLAEDAFTQKLNKVDRRQTGLDLVSNKGYKSIPLSLLEHDQGEDAKSNDKLFISINSSAQKLTYSGITKSDSVNRRFLTKPYDSQLLDVIPSSANHWQILTVDQTNSQEPKDPSYTSGLDFGSLSLEMATVGIKADTLMMFHLGSPSLLEQDLNLRDTIESFREFEIYAYDWDSSKIKNSNSLLQQVSSKYLVIINNFLVLSNSIASLKYCISSFSNKTTVAQTESFKVLSPNLRSSFSYMAYCNQTTLSRLFPDLDLPYNSSYYQLSLDDNVVHINGVLADYKKIKNANPVEELKSVSIDKDILKGPQLVKNHLNGGIDILIQDVENNLYLVSNKGKIYWKKRLNGPILGSVEQIDMYKNGRLQLAFCTRNKLYVLDRNGKDVNPFPKNFNDPITQPLAVFDYDKNRNYRLLITQGNELLMLDAKGKRVSGFKYSKSSTITSTPKHFRVGRKDFIVFKGGNTLHVLNRRGEDRLDVAEEIAFSNNGIYLYQSQFTTTTNKGNLIQVDTKGTLRQQSLQLPEDHRITSTSKTLVTQTENKLNIKLKSVEMDYGIYSHPEIFYLNDKIYVTTTDQQSKQVYLFDSQARPIKGFPIFGSSRAVMANLDNSKGIEMVVQTDSKSISILRLQY